MARRAAAIHGGHRNYFVHRRSGYHVLVPANCCCTWDCLSIALLPALLFLHCASSVRAGIRSRARIFGSADAGISLEEVAGDRLAFCRHCSLFLQSPASNQPSHANCGTGSRQYRLQLTLRLRSLLAGSSPLPKAAGPTGVSHRTPLLSKKQDRSRSGHS